MHALYAERGPEIAKRMRDYRRNNPEHSRNVSWLYYSTPKNRAKRLLRLAEQRARKQGITFDLSIDDIESRLRVGVCEATGIRFEMGSELSHRAHPFGPSIDRIEPKKGYTADNVRLVVFIHNVARGDWGDEYLNKYIQVMARV
jgi:hypothetical protein